MVDQIIPGIRSSRRIVVSSNFVWAPSIPCTDSVVSVRLAAQDTPPVNISPKKLEEISTRSSPSGFRYVARGNYPSQQFAVCGWRPRPAKRRQRVTQGGGAKCLVAPRNCIEGTRVHFFPVGHGIDSEMRRFTTSTLTTVTAMLDPGGNCSMRGFSNSLAWIEVLCARASTPSSSRTNSP